MYSWSFKISSGVFGKIYIALSTQSSRWNPLFGRITPYTSVLNMLSTDDKRRWKTRRESDASTRGSAQVYNAIPSKGVTHSTTLNATEITICRSRMRMPRVCVRTGQTVVYKRYQSSHT